MNEQWKRITFATAGWFFVALAAAGVVLPLLPTTPFLLLASSCFVRSSPRARHWLHNNRWFGPLLKDWNDHRAVRRPVKILAVVVIATFLTLMFFRDVPLPIRIVTSAVGLIGLIVVLRLPTRPADLPQNAESNQAPTLD